MNDRIPDEARDAIAAELEADTSEYRDNVPEGEWAKPNRGPSPLLTLRIPPETLEALQSLAAANGLPVSTLARGFILDGLAAHTGEDLRVALERLERDLAAVKARALAS
ncbi:hypothetical protein KPL76_07410 [Subtercola sp. PAMC28395]|uniref:hypothetical protein n=1 Tax=Subtercola sp. PAMC28395 TaxID=2846775 RepID=UPI001C0DB939|nr:hypothetical protein [Subtercola sp. PAMC28395]QWT25162.1 hypothetical protein KPL76_07410 [Subtercola sp. PAMC28395]